MKKNITCLLSIMLMVVMCTCGCTSNVQSDYQEELSCVQLVDISNMKISSDEIEVTEEDVNKAVETFIYMNEILIEKNETVETGDVVDLTVKNNGKENDYTDVTVGEDEVLDGLDKQLLGMSKGCTKEIFINNETYVVTICSIETYPSELTDAIVKEFTEYDTVHEFKKYIKGTIQSKRVEEEAYFSLVHNSAVIKEPTGLKIYVENMMSYYESAAQSCKMTLEDYLKSAYEFDEQECRQKLEDFYYEMLIVNAFAKKINVFPSEQQMEEWISQLAEEESCSSKEIAEGYGEEYLNYSYCYSEVCLYLVENVLIE